MIYDGKWVRLALVDVETPNRRRWDHHVVHLDRIAIALIVDAEDRALTLWRYRFATEQRGYELLGGLVDAGEHAATTAAREVAEESGGGAGTPGDLPACLGQGDGCHRQRGSSARNGSAGRGSRSPPPAGRSRGGAACGGCVPVRPGASRGRPPGRTRRAATRPLSERRMRTPRDPAQDDRLTCCSQPLGSHTHAPGDGTALCRSRQRRTGERNAGCHRCRPRR